MRSKEERRALHTTPQKKVRSDSPLKQSGTSKITKSGKKLYQETTIDGQKLYNEVSTSTTADTSSSQTATVQNLTIVGASSTGGTGTGTTPSSHAGLTGVTSDQHHPQLHTLNSHTDVSDITGTGTVLATSTSPTFVTPTLGAATATSVDFGSTTLLASRSLTVDTGGVFNIVLASAGGDDFTVDTNKLVVEGDTGNVGIGTAAPGDKLSLEIADDTTYSASDMSTLDGIRVYNSSTTGNAGAHLMFVLGSGGTCVAGMSALYESGDNSSLRFTIENSGTATEAMSIIESGYVGIGITEPITPLHVDNSGGATLELTRTANSTSGTLGEIQFGVSADGEDPTMANILCLADGANDSAKIAFGTQTASGTNTTRMTIKSTGKVGIGTVSPVEPLHVYKAANAFMAVTADAGSTAGLIMGDGGEAISSGNYGTIYWDGNTDTLNISTQTGGVAMYFDEDGQVGIGETAPDTQLEVLKATTQLKLSHSNGVDTTFGTDSSGDLTITPSGDDVFLGGGSSIGTSDYQSQTTGWEITDPGDADFRYLFVDELHAKSFIADLEQALAGGQIIAKSVAVLHSDYSLPAAGGNSTFTVKDLPSAPGMGVFVANDWIRFRVFTRPTSGNPSLTIADAWGTVTSYVDNEDGTQTWTFTRPADAHDGTASGTVSADSIVLDYGTTGNGFWEVNAIDGAAAINSPYAKVATWAGSNGPGESGVITDRVRVGNLKGITGTTNEFGLWAGVSSTQYLKATSVGLEIHSTAALYTAYTGSEINFHDGSANPKMTIGAGNITMFADDSTTAVAVWNDDVITLGNNSNTKIVLDGSSGDLDIGTKITLAGGTGVVSVADISLTGKITITSAATDNVCIGKWSSGDPDVGEGNIVIGVDAGNALNSNTDDVVLIGKDAGKAIVSSGAHANGAVAIGPSAMAQIAEPLQSTAVGYQSHFRGATSRYNVAVGYRAIYGKDTSLYARYNVAVGTGAMENGDGDTDAAGGLEYNTALGHAAMKDIDGGSNNIGIGHVALLKVEGDYNIGIGVLAGDNITSGSGNVIIGSKDAVVHDGDNQLIIASGSGGVTWLSGDSSGHVYCGGTLSCTNITTGQGNCELPAGTVSTHATTMDQAVITSSDVEFHEVECTSIDCNGPANITHTLEAYALELYNSHAEGHGLYIELSANSTANDYLIAGRSDNGGDSTSQFTVQSDGDVYVRGTVSSDRALKENIVDAPYGLSELLNVRAREFTFKNAGNNAPIKQGVIAQELEIVMPRAVKGEDGNKAVDYNSVLMSAVKAIQELSAKVTALEAQIN